MIKIIRVIKIKLIKEIRFSGVTTSINNRFRTRVFMYREFRIGRLSDVDIY